MSKGSCRRNVEKSSSYSENFRKLSLDGDTGRKGLVPKWEVLRLEGWSMVQPWKSTMAFTFQVLGSHCSILSRGV